MSGRRPLDPHEYRRTVREVRDNFSDSRMSHSIAAPLRREHAMHRDRADGARAMGDYQQQGVYNGRASTMRPLLDNAERRARDADDRTRDSVRRLREADNARENVYRNVSRASGDRLPKELLDQIIEPSTGRRQEFSGSLISSMTKPRRVKESAFGGSRWT